ncbi:23S rRNA (guanosine(2251)-2'-O)-methyltransferase RlmB [Candidatus Poribacteria bacterium]|nr:MAG: 23S rRNA (guanosine(2251)-2'-O)-methyltransferase RlmB [Candidatus Poribacteria bacterium]
MPDRIVGRNPVMEAILSNLRTIDQIWIAKDNHHPRLQEIINAARRKGIRIQRCPRNQLDRYHTNHQGVIADISEFQYTDFSKLLEGIQKKKGVPPIVIMLDQIQDPRNFGAILRTANATETDGVLIPKNNAVNITPAVHKAAAGSAEYTPIARVTNLAQTIERLKAVGVWVVGASGDADQPYTSADFTVPLCLVLGNEGQGIRRLVKQKCDYMVHLPMEGQINSLNVSVTAGVLLYEVLRQRTVK